MHDDSESDESSDGSDNADEEEQPMNVDGPIENTQPTQRSPTPQAALPSFPRPVVPDGPSKSTLALQGLDKALLGAELVDPSRTLPLDGIIRNPGELPVLSERMKKRLTELGIVELFAGAF